MTRAASRTTRASRKRARISAWAIGAAVIFGSAVVGALILGSLYDGGGPIPVTVGAGAAAALVAGGVLAGVSCRWDFSRRGFVAALFMPMPTVLVAYVLGAGLSEKGDGTREMVLIAALLLALWEIPLVATLLVIAAVRWRARETLATRPPAPPSLEDELKAATRSGRATTVVREYVDDAEGLAHLRADTEALATHGYRLMSVDREPGRSGLRKAAGVIFYFAMFQALDPDNDAAHLVATFRLDERRPS